jgi:hypothetical protein
MYRIPILFPYRDAAIQSQAAHVRKFAVAVFAYDRTMQLGTPEQTPTQNTHFA